jgi:hypothetical protein
MKKEGRIDGSLVLVNIDGETVGCTTGIPAFSSDPDAPTATERTDSSEMVVDAQGFQEFYKPVQCVIYAKRKNVIYVTNIENGQRGKFDSDKLSNTDYKAKDLPLGTLITLHWS